jgi:hypothetical protein
LCKSAAFPRIDSRARKKSVAITRVWVVLGTLCFNNPRKLTLAIKLEYTIDPRRESCKEGSGRAVRYKSMQERKAGIDFRKALSLEQHLGSTRHEAHISTK